MPGQVTPNTHGWHYDNINDLLVAVMGEAPSKATTLAANTATQGYIIGTPVVTAIPDHSLIIANGVDNADIIMLTTRAADSNTVEIFRVDSSAGLVVLNEGGEDWDFRIESDTQANFVVFDAGRFSGQGMVAIGGGASSLGFLAIDPTATTLVASTNFGRLYIDNSSAITVPAGTSTVIASLFVGEPNITATGTVTNAATVYIEAAPTEGGTTNHALFVDAGSCRFDGTVNFGVAGSVTGVIAFGGATSGTVTIQALAAAGTYTLSLPPDDGTAGQQLQTDGSGVLTWEAAGSYREAKEILGTLVASEALSRIVNTPIHRFRYKQGHPGVGGDYVTEFAGVISDEAPWAMAHEGRIFSPISAFGHAAAAIQALTERITALEARA